MSDVYDHPGDDIYPESFYATMRDDLVLHPDKLAIQSLEIPELHHKYLRMKKRAEKRLEKVQETHETIMHGLYLYFEGRANDEVYKDNPIDANLTFSTKGELERFVKQKKAYKESIAEVNLWKHRVSFLNDTVKSIDSRSFHISNAIKYLQFMKGEI